MIEKIRQQVNDIKEHYDEIKAGYNTAFMLMSPRVLGEWDELNRLIDAYFTQRQNPDIKDFLFERWLHRHYTVKKYYLDRLFYEQIWRFTEDYREEMSGMPEDLWLPSVRVVESTQDFSSFYGYTRDLSCHSTINNFSMDVGSVSFWDQKRDEEYEDEICWMEDDEANRILGHAIDFIKCLSRILDDFRFITSYDSVLFSKLATEEQISQALTEGFRDYSKHKYKETRRGLKREEQTIKRLSNPKLNDAQAWEEVGYKEEEIYELTWNQKLKDADDWVLEGIDESRKEFMESNKHLINSIKECALDDELFGINDYVQRGSFKHLNDENLKLFYYLILRHNIIVGEMNGELKKSFSEWLSQEPNITNHEMSDADRNLKESIMGYVRKVDWQGKASCEKATAFFEDIFTNEQEFRDFFKNVRAGKDNVKNEVAMANIIGHLMRFGLIGCSQTEISKSVFGKDMSSNINRTYRDNGKPSQAFLKLKPILEEYRKKYF